ncbi:Serine hydroxymethyltransferase, cytosolic, variant 3 [Dermatophagoides farinae]|uniref:Serine hydroxymethyltransferase, cytosolic, variant 3 n=1 Tax=Dermatophagoides farinae TaxID=6954 RepID=A0A922L4F4_DERFA|nr:Serine hydroxymethyltransferase, cytosolic, variant 3 [Dermatophagoides farinae]
MDQNLWPRIKSTRSELPPIVGSLTLVWMIVCCYSVFDVIVVQFCHQPWRSSILLWFLIPKVPLIEYLVMVVVQNM